MRNTTMRPKVPPLRLVVFDLDLTLIDTREAHIQGLTHCFQACLGVRPDLSTFDATSGMLLDEILRDLFRHSDVAHPVSSSQQC
jgi:phosphoglycolate phosphatase-like HAD superfamily hydrolase